MNEFRNARWDYALPADSMGAVFSHVFLVHNLFDAWRYKINPPLWSVGLEWQLYFALPLVILPVWRKLGVLGVVFSSFLVGFGSHWILELKSENYFWYIFLFVLGAVAGRESQFPTRSSAFQGLSGIVFFVTGIPLLLIFLTSPFVPIWRWLWEHEYCLDFLIGVVVSSYLLRESHFWQASPTRTSSIGRILSSPVFVVVGTFSYSLYLTHYPVLSLLYLYLEGMQFSPVCLLFYELVIGAVVCLSFAYIFYIVVEMPFSHSRVQLSRKFPLVLAGSVVGAFVAFGFRSESRIAERPFYPSSPQLPPSAFNVRLIEGDENPVLSTGDPGSWESVDVLNPSVVDWKGKL
jgi:peptidoglycan/LPS O-acetylase OafA/YrhL